MAAPKTPTVSVCIPSYDHAEYLPEAVESVLTQTYPKLELVVFDDGSTDGSLELARRYEASDPRVRVLTHDGGVNRGIVPTLNAATSEARGDYVKHLAADDVLYRDSITRLVGGLAQDPEAQFVYGHVELVDADGKAMGRIGGRSPVEMCTHDRTSDPLVSLILHNYVPAPTALVRRELVLRVGGFDAEVYYSDWELWIRLLAHTSAVFVDGPPLAAYRIHGHALTQEDADLDRPRRLDLYRALDRKGASVGGRFVAPRVRALVALQRALHAADLGYEDEAAAALDRAFEVDAELPDDTDFLFWWLGPLQKRRLERSSAAADAWLSTFARPSAAAGEITAAGAATGRLDLWTLHTARGRLSDAAVERLVWALLGNELESGVGVPERLLAVRGVVGRLVARPRLVRDRWFFKALLCAAGVWKPAVAARQRFATLRHPGAGRAS